MKKLFLLALASLFISFNLSAQKHAEIVFEATVHDFGDIGKSDAPLQKHSFKFWNSGDAALHIEGISSGCPCLTAKYPSDSLSPGDTSEIVVTYDGSRQSPSKFNINVFVQSNAEPKYSRLILKGNLVNALAKKRE